jgi:glutamine synthetase
MQTDNFTGNLSERLKKDNKLEKIIELLEQDHGLRPRIGVEIEFYCHHELVDRHPELVSGSSSLLYEILNQVHDDGSTLTSKLRITKEKGKNQYEIDLAPSCDLISYINDIEKIRLAMSGIANFESKPYEDDYGSSMHFHIDFICDFDINLCANSLCHYMLASFLAFMPNEDDYKRINHNFMAPTHVCHGPNNRSVAVRIPDSLPKRLEHRVSSSLCDPYLAIFAILKAILLGLQNPEHITKYPIVYGNAFDPQYRLTPLPQTIEEARKLFNKKFFD